MKELKSFLFALKFSITFPVEASHRQQLMMMAYEHSWIPYLLMHLFLTLEISYQALSIEKDSIDHDENKVKMSNSTHEEKNWNIGYIWKTLIFFFFFWVKMKHIANNYQKE